MGEVIFEFLGIVFVEFIWAKVFGAIGASIRWLFGTLWRTLFGKPIFKFRDYLYGIENSGDWFDTSRRSINSIFGLIAVILLIYGLVGN